MAIDQFKSTVIPAIKSVKGIKDAYVDDYNQGNATIVVEPDNPASDLRPVSGALRKKLRELGFSSKKGTLTYWESPQKRKDKDSDDFVISSKYFLIDLDYGSVSEPDMFDQEWIVYEKHNYSGLSNKDFGEIVKKAYGSNIQTPGQHAKLIEGALGGKYDVTPLWKYEHSGISFELFQRCRFDSGVTGFIAIKKNSDKTPGQIVEILNNSLEH